MKKFFHRDGQARLLPNLSVLAFLELALMFLPRLPILAGIGVILVLVYLGYIVLVTRDILVDVAKLHPIDRFLCRWSGPLAVAIGVGLVGLVVLVAVIGPERPLQETWISSRSGLFTIKYTMEVGFILSVACWWVPRGLGHVRPIFVWQILVIPLVVIYGSYVVLIPLGQFFGDCDIDLPEVTWTTFGQEGLSADMTTSLGQGRCRPTGEQSATPWRLNG